MTMTDDVLPRDRGVRAVVGAHFFGGWVEMAKLEFPHARILIVDDEELNVLLLEQILLQQGYTNIRGTTDPHELFILFAQAEPDLILLDLMMPEMSGFEVMDRLATIIPPDAFLPILVLTADSTPQARNRALAGQATDFLTKPLDAHEVLLRIRNLLTTRSLYLQMRDQNRTLDQKVKMRTAELAQAQEEILIRLARAAEFRDDDTGQHTQRVGRTAAMIARELRLPPEQIELIEKASPLHDVGKIGISDLILLKPGKLSEEEFVTVKTHTGIGDQLLSGGNSDLIQAAQRIAGTHHERWDGRGYPQGLRGEEIPIEGRIVAVADVFDALTNERPYKKAWSQGEALSEIQNQSGRQFDPSVVSAFLQAMGQSVEGIGV
jgi:putative two-component system response regulator